MNQDLNICPKCGRPIYHLLSDARLHQHNGLSICDGVAVSMLGEVEQIRVPLTQLVRQVENAGKQYESPEWRNFHQALNDALHALDIAQEWAESGHLEMVTQ